MYSSYDNPGEFFNLSPTTSGYSVAAGSITLGTFNGSTAAHRFLPELTDAQAAPSTGSVAQVLFALNEALFQRLNAIKALNAANAPTKFNISRSGYIDPATNEIVYTYSTTVRLSPGTLTAVNA
jgi:hypothetical protein